MGDFLLLFVPAELLEEAVIDMEESAIISVEEDVEDEPLSRRPARILFCEYTSRPPAISIRESRKQPPLPGILFDVRTEAVCSLAYEEAPFDEVAKLRLLRVVQKPSS